MNTEHEIIAADIGNNSMTLCRMAGLRVEQTIDTSSQVGIAEVAAAISDLSRETPLVIASVNPRGLATLEQAWGKPGFALGRDGIVPISNRTRTPEQAGQDRLCNALAAKHRVGGNAIVIDFGSAITLDVVNDSAYIGGAIAPGIGLAMEALHQKTAMLPLVEIGKSKPPVIGNDTVSAIQAGVYFGYIGLVRNLLAETVGMFKEEPGVIATGGYGVHLAPEIPGVDEVVPELTHLGIALAWRDLQSKK